ncbi:hypothetical protein ONZ45_g13425 [Pleurotus djamor]|nr:hypothetical protein ONZ45_g13425 [Pleurotus djamor]
MSESGIYYVIPDQYGGGGKRLVRRHPPPLTTAPLDDDFDALSQTQGYTAITPTIERIENESYYSHYAYDRDGQTSVPMDDDFDAVTYDYTTVGKAQGWRDHQGGDERSDVDLRRRAYEGLARASPIRSSDTSQSTSGRRRGSGGSGEREVPRSPPKHRVEPAERIRSRTMSEIQRRPTHSPAMGNSRSLTKRPTGEMKPSKLGEQFEMVRRKIIEDSPEKTVTISMWRENVADAGGSNGGGSRSSEVGMSVYYVNPDDYAIEEGGDAMREEVISEVPAHGHKWSGTSRGVERRAIDAKSRVGRGDGQTTASYEYHGYEQRQDPYYTARTTPSIGQPGSFPTTSRSSQTTRSRTRNGSGSSQSIDNPMTLAARNILASCTPSLLHVSPILVTLGITTEEHLKAMVRLNEDTRDRVVRDEALRKGITVMEWAILLDRLREL